MQDEGVVPKKDNDPLVFYSLEDHLLAEYLANTWRDEAMGFPLDVSVRNINPHVIDHKISFLC